MADQTEVTAPITASDVRVPVEDASFLRAVLEAIPSFVVRLDPEQRIRYINHLRAGVTLDQVIGRPASELVAPEDLERYQSAVEQALRTGEIRTYLARGTRSVTSRGPAYYECYAVPIDNGDGRRAVCIVAADVSEQVARADALQASEEKLRIAVEATGIGLWTWDMTEDRVDWNDRMTEILGCKPMPLRDYVARLVHPDDRERVAREGGDARSGRPLFPEHRIIRPDGQVRWLLPCGRVMRDEGGHATRLTGGTLDVTAQRRIDEHLRRAQKLDAVGSLTAGVTHNFNNMLAVIMPALELARRDAPEAQAQILEDATHAAQRAAELVAQLMTFAGQRRTPTAKPHDLATVVERAVSMCRRTFERQLQIETTLEPGCAEVACDPTAIEQVIVNLLINARDAVRDAQRSDPRIRVELSETVAPRPDAPAAAHERYVRIAVVDNGVGMDDAVKHRLFEPFFTTKAPGKGTGLGLATSYGIVRDHGGYIAIESQPGAGTTAAVLLQPAYESGSTARRSAAPAAASRRGTVLVVDDEPAVRRIVELVLVERGHDVHSAADGEAAVTALDGGLHPDVILLDRSMPGWSVRLTIDELRKRRPSVPIVFFTGQDVPSEERAQVQDVLYKPLATDDLVRAVEHWVRALA